MEIVTPGTIGRNTPAGSAIIKTVQSKTYFSLAPRDISKLKHVCILRLFIFVIAQTPIIQYKNFANVYTLEGLLLLFSV